MAASSTSGQLSEQELVQELKKLRSAVITAHVSPDADAVGSACALQRGLASLGIDTAVYLFDPFPQRMRAIAGEVPLLREVPQKSFDAVIVVDTATKARVGADVERLLATGEKSFNIDHHASNELWAERNFIDASVAASAVIVERLLRGMGAKIDKTTANLLLAGLSEDTGSFRFSNADAGAFTCAVTLLGYGASPEEVSNTLYYSVPDRTLRLQEKALATLEMALNGTLSSITVTLAMMQEAGALPEDTEGLVDLARSIQGTVAAVFIRELAPGVWKLSLRSKTSALDVNAIASVFGGGGHKAAAGCTVRAELAEVKRRVIAEFEKALK